MVSSNETGFDGVYNNKPFNEPSRPDNSFFYFFTIRVRLTITLTQTQKGYEHGFDLD